MTENQSAQTPLDEDTLKSLELLLGSVKNIEKKITILKQIL